MKRGLNHKNSLPDPEFGRESSESARAIHYVVQKDVLMTYVSALIAQADPGIVSGSTIERKKMSTKTIYKRIALVAVASLGFGVLTSISPASASKGTLTLSGTTVARGGASGAAAGLIFTPGTALASTDTIAASITTFNGATLATVPAGITFAGNANTTSANSGNTITATASGAVTSATLTVGTGVPAGKYGYSVVTNDVVANPDVAGTALTGFFYVSGAPTKAAFDKATYAAEGTATAAATVALTDINGNPSYLLAGEAVQITSSATAATSSVVLLDSGNYTAATATTGNIATNLSNSAGTAGTYTFTASGASGQTGFTSGSATLTVAAAAATVETVTLATGTLAIGRDTADAVANRTNASNASAALGATSIFVSPTQTSVTYKLVDTGEAAAKNFRYSISQTSSVPFPGGIAASAAPVYIPAAVTTAGSNGISANLTITTTSALAGTGYTLTIEGGTHDIVYTVLYQAPVAYDIDLNDANATTIAAVKLATTSQKVKVTDQFGSAFPNAVVSYTTATRNTVAVKTAVTGADGVATITTTDAALSTSTADDALNATIPTVSLGGTYPGAAFDGTANTTIKYYATAADIAAATITLAANRPATPGTTATYDTVVTTSTTASVTVDTTLDNSASDQVKIADQVLIAATIANAAAANPQGVPVSVSGSAGVFFLQGSAVGEVPVGTQTGAKTTLASYTGASGDYSFQAAFTKSGTATITVTSGTVSKTYSIKVVAGAAGIVSATASTGGVVVAKVTDLWGNPVSGATVSFVAASGALLGGNFPSLSASTGADGTASTVVTGVTPTASYVVSATITGGDSGLVADTTNGVPAGKATVDVTVTGTGVSADAANTASLAALTTLINSLIAKINALNKLVIKIQKKVRA